VLSRRIQKSERIKKAFDGTQQGLTAFINEARGKKEMEKITEEEKNISPVFIIPENF